MYWTSLFFFEVADDGIHSAQSSSFSSESNNNAIPPEAAHLPYHPNHTAYTRGIDVQNINCAGETKLIFIKIMHNESF